MLSTTGSLPTDGVRQFVVPGTSVNPFVAFLIGPANVQGAAALSALHQTSKQAEISPCVRALPALDFLLHNFVSVPVNDGLVHPLNYNPVLPLLVAHPADFETVIDLLRSNRADVNRVCQNTLDSGEVPNKPRPRSGSSRSNLVTWSRNPFCRFHFQPAVDAVGAAAVLRQFKNHADGPCGILVNEKIVFVLRVFAVAERGQTAGKLAGLGFCQVGGMDFLAKIPATHLVQQRAKRGYLILNLAVDGIIQSDIPAFCRGKKSSLIWTRPQKIYAELLTNHALSIATHRF